MGAFVRRNITYLVLLLIVLSCERSPVSNDFDPQPFDFSQVGFRMSNYDTVQVFYKPGGEMRSKSWHQVVLGKKDSVDFVPLKSAAAVFDPSTSEYVVNLDLRFGSNPTNHVESFTIRFLSPYGQFYDIDTSIVTIGYPYPSAEVVLLWNARPYVFEDIEVHQNKIYLQAASTYGYVWIYDPFKPVPLDSIYLNVYEVIAIDDSSNIYFDHTSFYSIYKLNLITRVFTEVVPHRGSTAWFTFGLEYYQGFLYEIVSNRGPISLMKYTYGGLPIDSAIIVGGANRLTIHDGIAFIQKGNDPTIRRFNLQTKSYLSEIKSPMLYGEGIRIRDNYFYFLDYNKKLVGRVKLQEILGTL